MAAPRPVSERSLVNAPDEVGGARPIQRDESGGIAAAGLASCLLYVLWRRHGNSGSWLELPPLTAKQLGAVVAAASTASIVAYTFGRRENEIGRVHPPIRSQFARTDGSNEVPGCSKRAESCVNLGIQSRRAAFTSSATDVVYGHATCVKPVDPPPLPPEERLFAELVAGGSVASASLESILARARKLVSRYAGYDSVSPPGPPGASKRALRLLVRLDDAIELASRPGWCSQLAQCGHSRLEELAAILAYVESYHENERCYNVVADLQLISELLDCLGQDEPVQSSTCGVASPDSVVDHLRDTVEQLTVQMSLLERSSREEYAEMSMAQTQNSIATNEQLELSQKIDRLQADLTTAEDQQSEERRARADAEAKLVAVAQQLEASGAHMEHQLAALTLQVKAERAMAAAEASEAVSKAALELVASKLSASDVGAGANNADGHHGSNANGPNDANSSNDARSSPSFIRSQRYDRPGRARSSSPLWHSQMEAQLREICCKLSMQELCEEVERAGIDVELQLNDGTDWHSNSTEQKESLVDLLVSYLGGSMYGDMHPRQAFQSPQSKTSRAGGSDISPVQIERINVVQRNLLEQELADTQQTLYATRESLQMASETAQDAMLRNAVSLDRLEQTEVFIEHLTSSKATALAQADAKFSELESTTKAELENERSERKKVEEQVRSYEEQAEAARLQRKREQEEIAAIKAEEQAAAAAAAARVAEEKVLLEQQAAKAALDSAISRASELRKQLGEANSKLAELELKQNPVTSSTSTVLEQSDNSAAKQALVPAESTTKRETIFQEQQLDEITPPALTPSSLSASLRAQRVNSDQRVLDLPTPAVEATCIAQVLNAQTRSDSRPEDVVCSSSSSSSSDEDRCQRRQKGALPHAQSEPKKSDLDSKTLGGSAAISRAPAYGFRSIDARRLHRFLGRQTRKPDSDSNKKLKPASDDSKRRVPTQQQVPKTVSKHTDGQESRPQLEKRSRLVDSPDSESELQARMPQMQCIQSDAMSKNPRGFSLNRKQLVSDDGQTCTVNSRATIDCIMKQRDIKVGILKSQAREKNERATAGVSSVVSTDYGSCERTSSTDAWTSSVSQAEALLAQTNEWVQLSSDSETDSEQLPRVRPLRANSQDRPSDSMQQQPRPQHQISKQPNADVARRPHGNVATLPLIPDDMHRRKGVVGPRKRTKCVSAATKSGSESEELHDVRSTKRYAPTDATQPTNDHASDTTLEHKEAGMMNKHAECPAREQRGSQLLERPESVGVSPAPSSKLEHANLSSNRAMVIMSSDSDFDSNSDSEVQRKATRSLHGDSALREFWQVTDDDDDDDDDDDTGAPCPSWLAPRPGKQRSCEDAITNNAKATSPSTAKRQREAWNGWRSDESN